MGASAATGAGGGVVPVPLSVTVCGEPEALSATVRIAEKLVADAGVKVTEIEQLEPIASMPPQVLDSLKSLGFVPVMVMPVIVSEALPGLESLTLRAVAVVPTTYRGT